MGEWPDAKIRSTALWYIGKHTMDPPTWRYTVVGEAHPELSARVELQPCESPLVSFFLSAESLPSSGLLDRQFRSAFT